MAGWMGNWYWSAVDLNWEKLGMKNGKFESKISKKSKFDSNFSNLSTITTFLLLNSLQLKFLWILHFEGGAKNSRTALSSILIDICFFDRSQNWSLNVKSPNHSIIKQISSPFIKNLNASGHFGTSQQFTVFTLNRSSPAETAGDR